MAIQDEERPKLAGRNSAVELDTIESIAPNSIIIELQL